MQVCQRFVFGAAVWMFASNVVLARTWTDNTGRHRAEADFVDASGTEVRLALAGGGAVRTVPLSRLSRTDQEYVARRVEGRAGVTGREMPAGTNQTVVVEGVGRTAEEALQDAFRNAVRQVVGALVDAETLVRNDEIISDQILVFSEGFVATYEILDDRFHDGLYRRKIVASVKRGSLLTRLRSSNVVTGAVDGRSLSAEAFGRMEAERDAARLLQRYFEHYPASVLVAQPNGKPRLDGRHGGNATVVQDLRIAVDPERYQAMQQGLVNLLGQVAVQQGSVLARDATVPARSREAAQELLLSHFLGQGDSAARGESGNQIKFSAVRSIVRTYVRGLPNDWQTASRSSESATLVVVRTGSKDHMTSWRWFQVAGRPAVNRGRVLVESTYLGKDQSEVASDSFELGPRCPGLALEPGWESEQGLRIMVVSPYFLHHDGHGYQAEAIVHARNLTLSRPVELSLPDLARVESVRCRVSMK